MNKLTFINRNDVFTTSLIIAENTGNQHESVATLIKKYNEDFQESGALDFIDLKSGKRGRPTRVYNLNEEQALILVTYLDNTPIVRKFKKALVREFIAMREILLQQKNTEWQELRQEGKRIRLKETDAIKELVVYAKAQGSKNADKLYMSYSKLVKQLAGYDKRDTANADMLQLVAFMERLLAGICSQEMQHNTFYKDIYQKAKHELQNIRDIWFAPRLTA